MLAPHDINESLPLIYMWEIRDRDGQLRGRYVGKAKAGAGRPLMHYKRNVRNILLNRPYRKGKPDGYRRVHVALAEAQRDGMEVTLHFLCNVSADDDINEVERRLIRERDCVGPAPWQLNG